MKAGTNYWDYSPQKGLWTTDPEDNISWLLNKIADLPFCEKTISTFFKKSHEQSLQKVIDSLLLIAQASLAASKTFLLQLLAPVNLALNT